MEPKVALEQRKLEPLSPYNGRAWEKQLSDLGLEEKYPLLMQGLTSSFDLGIPHIAHTYTPLNHPSIRLLPNVYSSMIDSEFAAGCYIGPFTHRQLELVVGPFQTSLLSLVLKTSKL
jgi:hypothetical protein